MNKLMKFLKGLFSSKNNVDHDALILLQARYHSLLKERRTGSIADDLYQIELQKIIRSLFNLHDIDITASFRNEAGTLLTDEAFDIDIAITAKAPFTVEDEVNIKTYLAKKLNQDTIPIDVFLLQNRYDRLKMLQIKQLISESEIDRGLRVLKRSIRYSEMDDRNKVEVISKDKSIFFLGNIKERANLLLDNTIKDSKTITEIRNLCKEHDAQLESLRIGVISIEQCQIMLNSLDSSLIKIGQNLI